MQTTNQNITIAKPTISVKNIIKRRDTLTKATTSFLGHKLVEGQFEGFVDTLHKELPTGILRQTVQSSVVGLLKKELDSRKLLNTCWRLAANVDTLKMQVPVNDWQFQEKNEWVMAQVTDTRVQKNLSKLEYHISFKVLSGTPASMSLTERWSSKKLHYLARYRDEQNNGFGFGRSRLNGRGEQTGKLLFLDIKQFFGLRCLLLVDAENSKDYLAVSEIGHTNSTMCYNKELLKNRDRQQTPCVKGIDNQECFFCPYGTDKCSFATHEVSYAWQTCNVCQEFGFADPTDDEYANTCITCANSERFNRKSG